MMWGNEWVYKGIWDRPEFIGFFGFLATIDLILKGFALWRSAKAGQQWWFIALLLINSLGILPAIYLYLNRYSAPKKSAKKTSKKK